MSDLKQQVRNIARNLRRLGHTVTILPLADDLFAFQRRLRRLNPDVVFNLYDDVVHGALYDMRLAALVRMMGYPMTGSPGPGAGPDAATSSCRPACSMGAGMPIPPNTACSRPSARVDQSPVAVPDHRAAQPGARRRRPRPQLRRPLQEGAQGKGPRDPRRPTTSPPWRSASCPAASSTSASSAATACASCPLAEVDYADLPPDIPPIMSYAAKWVETSAEYQKTSVICPADVEPELAEQISQVAAAAFRAVGGRGYGRVDMRLDENDLPCVLEVNCNPCLDEGMGLARSAEKAGHLLPAPAAAHPAASPWSRNPSTRRCR